MRDKAQVPVRIFLTATFLAALASSAHGQANFRSLPPAVRPDGYFGNLISSRGFAVSDDGATIVGYSRDRHAGTSVGAFGTVWSLGPTGDYAASLLPPRDGSLGEPWQRIPQVATDVSADGSLVLTTSSNRVWSRGTGGQYSREFGSNVHVISFGSGWYDTHCRGMSASGEFVASGDYARRFSTATGAAEELPPPPDLLTQWDYTENVSISRDGRSMTGMGTTEIYSGYDEFVWRWRDGVGTERLPLNVGERPRAILADGSVIVSLPNPAGGVQAGRWMLDGSLIETGIPCFDVMSDDGGVFAAGGLVWTQATGVTTLDALAGPGVLPAGILFRVDAISTTGAFLLVNGVDPSTGYQVAGVLTIPAPGGMGLLSAVGLFAARRRRRSA